MTTDNRRFADRFSLFVKQTFKYYLVGASGVGVGLGLLYFLTDIIGIWYVISQGIAIVVYIYFMRIIFQKLTKTSYCAKHKSNFKLFSILKYTIIIINLVIIIYLSISVLEQSMCQNNKLDYRFQTFCVI